MPRVYNFSAGPGTLPEKCCSRRPTRCSIGGTGQSVMEMSHRGKEFISIAEGRRPIFASCSRFPRATTCLSARRSIAAVRDDPDEPDPGPRRL